MTTDTSFWLETTDSNIDAGAMFVHRIEGREAISQLCRYHIDIVVRTTDGAEPDTEAWLGARMCLLMQVDAGRPARRVWGMIAQIEDAATDGERRAYRLTLVPRAERLSLVQTQDVYLNMTVPDIIALKAKRVGLQAAFETRFADQYTVRPFVVQYRETDLAFVSRLSEHLGISLVIDQREERDVLVLVDHADGFKRIERPLVFDAAGAKGATYTLRRNRQIVPRHYGVQDYNPSTPDVEVAALAEVDGGHAGGIAEYAPHVTSESEARHLASIRAQETAGRVVEYHGSSAAHQLAAGRRMRFERHPRYGDLELLLVELQVRGSQPLPGSEADVERRFECSFTARPAAQPYRPPRRTPKPRIAGVIPGLVAPNAQSDLHAQARIDDVGRYTIKLLFDTAERPELRASAPVRMAQPFAGAGDGMHFPLRPGVEVALAFMDGDPDRPLIVGALPNAVTPSPVTAKNSVVNRIQTDSGIVVEFGDVLPPS